MNTDYFSDLLPSTLLPAVPGVPAKSPETGDSEKPLDTRLSPVSPVKNLEVGENIDERQTEQPVSRGRRARLSRLLIDACHGLPITPQEIYKTLGDKDRKRIGRGRVGLEALRAFARARVDWRNMHQGIVPDGWTEIAFCAGCGPVWLWTSGTFDGCPWSHQRVRGIPVPRTPGESPQELVV